MAELKLNVAVNVVEAALEHFHHDNGGIIRLPRLTKVETQSGLVKYELHDAESIASLTIRPISDRGCNLTFYFNDSKRFSWLLGAAGHSELGETTKLGMNSSKDCEEFCTKFAEYLDKSGYLITMEDNSNGDRPIFEEDIWAQQQYAFDRPVEEIYPEWLERRKKAERPELTNPLDSFNKVIYKK
jgi:hypothetical protein